MVDQYEWQRWWEFNNEITQEPAYAVGLDLDKEFEVPLPTETTPVNQIVRII